MKQTPRSAALFILMLSLAGCEGCGDDIVKGIITIAEAPMVQKRIAGAQFIDLEKPDVNDNFLALNGFLCVVHDPGCGITGNDGVDKFFFNAKQLPLLCKLDQVEFLPFWPKGIDSNSSGGGIGGWGSYGAELKPTLSDGSVEVHWNNACQGSFGDKDLFYQISFIITMPVGADIGETTFDVGATTPGICAPPERYSKVRQTGVSNTTIAPSGFAGSAKYCNPTTTVANGQLVIEGTCIVPLTGAQGSPTMSEKISISFDPSGGGIPSVAGFKTNQDYQQGTWEITKAEIQGLTGPLPGLPLKIELPGGVGNPVLDFNPGPCLNQ